MGKPGGTDDQVQKVPEGLSADDLKKMFDSAPPGSLMIIRAGENPRIEIVPPERKVGS